MLLRIEVCVVALEHERGVGCAASRLVERVIARPELLGVRLALEKLLILHHFFLVLLRVLALVDGFELTGFLVRVVYRRIMLK